MMRAVVATAPGSFGVELINSPQPGSEDVLIKIYGCAICGSDVKLLNGTMAGVGMPLVPGHEWSGQVVDAGHNARKLIGRNVVADILQTCEHCKSCLSGMPNLCNNLIEPGLTAQGGYAEFIAVPARTVHVLPESVPLDTACFVEPLAVALYMLKRQPSKPDDRVAILGAGGIGMLILLALRDLGVLNIVVIDPHAYRRELAKTLGALSVHDPTDSNLSESILATLGSLPSIIYNAASRVDAFDLALSLVAPGGSVGLVGYSGSSRTTIAPSDLVVKLISIRSALSPTGTWCEAIDLLARGRINPAPLLTHEVSLDEFSVGLELEATRADGAVRVVIRP